MIKPINVISSPLRFLALSLLFMLTLVSGLEAQNESYEEILEAQILEALKKVPPSSSTTGLYDFKLPDWLEDLVEGSLLDRGKCELIKEVLVKDMERLPIYRGSGSDCLDADPLDADAEDGPYFADSACQTNIDFQTISFARYCLDNLLGNERSKAKIGNPEEHPGFAQRDGFRSTPWTMSPGHQLKLNVVDQTRDTHQPFVKVVEYAKVGDCSLGLHIYRKDLKAQDLQPILLIHGGGWRLRGQAAIAGIETIAPNLTERGFVVFAPFHRLVEKEDGPEACRGATGQDLLNDIETAKDWVFENGAHFGMDPSHGENKRLSVVGQSSGAHLAAYLATQHPKEIKRALLLYPATDFRFLIENTKLGGLYADFTKGLERLESFIAPSQTFRVDDLAALPLVATNSFPPRINEAPSEFPEFFLIHGSADSQVPVENSSRLCQALDPDEKPADGLYNGPASRDCGKDSEMRLISGADHILDLRCVGGNVDKAIQVIFGQSFCLAGSEAGAEATAEALIEAYDFLAAPTP